MALESTGNLPFIMDLKEEIGNGEGRSRHLSIDPTRLNPALEKSHNQLLDYGAKPFSSQN